MTVERAEIERNLDLADRHVVQIVDAGAPRPPGLPASWLPIAEADDPRTRALAALALWPTDFLDLVPEFARTLRTKLADVVVGRSDDEWVLIYAVEDIDGDDRDVVCWIGWDPATFGETPPPLWDCLPGPLQRFLTDVHAGFTAPDSASFGPPRPKHMQTLAALSQWPDGIPDWDQQPDSTRLLPIVATYSLLMCCVSPDLPTGTAVACYQGELDPPESFGAAFDDIVHKRFLIPEGR